MAPPSETEAPEHETGGAAEGWVHHYLTLPFGGDAVVDDEPSTRSKRLGLLTVIVIPFLANLPAILGLVKYQPLVQTSGLGVVTKMGYTHGQPFIDPNVGYNSEAIGRAAATAWLHLHIPWWNVNGGMGMPLAASVQSAAFLPLTLLQALSNGSMWFHLSLELVAGLATYALLRELRCSPFAAALGGIAYQLNGSLAWLTNAPANPIPFLPLCLLGVEYIVNASGAKRKGGWIVLSLGIWLTVAAGFPEVAVINAGLVAVWFVMRLIQRWPDRTGILIRGAIGVLVGLLLAAPVLNAFLRLLKVANVGIHVGPLSWITIPKAGLAQLVSPYVFGGIFDTQDAVVTGTWSRIGGYAGATLLVLAIAAMFGRKERVLRYVLGGWALLFLGSNFGVPILHQIVQNLPGLNHVAVYRYSMSSALICLCLLAALCLDDLRGLSASRILFRVAPGIIFAIVIFAIGFLGTPTGRAYAISHLPSWYWLSLALFVGVLGAMIFAIVLGLMTKRSIVRVVIGAVLVIEAFGYFEVPILAWPRAAHVDLAPVHFLQTHLGGQRYYSTGPVAPNFGAYFNLASLDASDLPIPKVWGNYVHSSLSPCILPWQFGNGGPVAGCPVTPVVAMMQYVTNYEALGVKYLVVGKRTHLSMFIQPQIGTGVATPDGGAQIVMGWGPPHYFHGGVITRIAVVIPRGAPPGVQASACSGGICEPATFEGAGIGGEQFVLAQPLVAQSNLTLTLTSTPAAPIHIITVPKTPGLPSSVVADGVVLPDRLALARFTYEPTSIPQLVETSEQSHIYRLPHTSPIATAPGCIVAQHSMTTFTVRCAHPTLLTYRELSFKGWSANVAGHPVPITTVSRVLQRIAVPAGISSVVFSYAPPDTTLAWLCVLVGLLCIAGSLARRRWPDALSLSRKGPRGRQGPGSTRRRAGPSTPLIGPDEVAEPATPLTT